MKGGIKIAPSIKLGQSYDPNSGATCLWYDTVEVKFEIDPTIVIAREVDRDACMSKAVREHEMKHVKVDRQIVNAYAKIMGDKIYKALQQRGFYAGPMSREQSKSAAERMQKTVFQIIEHEYKKMEIERAEKQQAVDSLEEYNRVSAVCPNFRG